MDFVLEFLNQLMRGVVYGRAKRKEKMVQRKDRRSSAEGVLPSIYA